MRKIKKAKGFTLIELLLVIGIISGVTTGIILVAADAIRQQEIRGEVIRVKRLQAVIEGATSTSASPATLTTERLAQLAPDDYRSGADLVHPLGGRIVYRAYDPIFIYQQSFKHPYSLTYDGLDSKTCVRLGQAMSFITNGMIVNNDQVLIEDADGSVGLDPAQLGLSCDQALNEITFFFYKPTIAKIQSYCRAAATWDPFRLDAVNGVIEGPFPEPQSPSGPYAPEVLGLQSWVYMPPADTTFSNGSTLLNKGFQYFFTPTGIRLMTNPPLYDRVFTPSGDRIC